MLLLQFPCFIIEYSILEFLDAYRIVINMAVARRPRWRPLLLIGLLAAIAGSVVAKKVAQLSVPEIEDAIQVGICSLVTPYQGRHCICTTGTDYTKGCPIVQELNIHKRATSPQTSSWISQIFEQLFPGSPAVNALLATLYISGPPSQCFRLALMVSPSANAGFFRFPSRAMPSKY